MSDTNANRADFQIGSAGVIRNGREILRVGMYRGVDYVLRPTAYDLVVGDRVVCMLSDAVAAVEVTAIRYEEVDLTRHGVTNNPRSCRVVCEYSAAPWWVDKTHMTFDISHEVPVQTAGEMTEADRRFFALRESGYTGPIDQDGNKVE